MAAILLNKYLFLATLVVLIPFLTSETLPRQWSHLLISATTVFISDMAALHDSSITIVSQCVDDIEFRQSDQGGLVFIEY